MSDIDVLKSLVREFEGLRLKAYKCPAGVWTIGYGHTGGVKPNDVITAEKAEELLNADCQERIAMALKASPSLSTQTPGRVAAVADFIYNVGLGNYHSSTFKRNVDTGDFEAAKVSVLKWNKATDPATGKKVVLAGLTKRRAAEARLL